jgi:hypothetical protein
MSTEDYPRVLERALESCARGDARIPEAKQSLHEGLRARVLPELFKELGVLGESFKLDTRMVAHADDRSLKMFIPLNAFFFTGEKEPKLTHFRLARDTIVITLVSAYGPFYFVVTSLGCDAGWVTLSPHQPYADGQPRLTLISKLPDAKASRFVAITRVDPYVCANCGRVHAPRMPKCKGCWDAHRIAVRYCSQECQKEDYGARHRLVCGRRASAPGAERAVCGRKAVTNRGRKAGAERAAQAVPV